MVENITRVVKVGNSLMIALQPNILAALGIKRGDRIGVWVEGEYAVIRRIPMEELIRIRPTIASNTPNVEEVDNG